MIQLLSVFNDWYVELSWSPDVWDWLLLHWAAECCCKVKMFPHQNELFLINTSHNSVKVWPSQIQNKTCMSGTVPIRIWIHFSYIFIHFYIFYLCLGDFFSSWISSYVFSLLMRIIYCQITTSFSPQFLLSFFPQFLLIWTNLFWDCTLVSNSLAETMIFRLN